jgi:glucose-6-phosphate dehydrogenase assembly protein OpcA
VEATVVDVQLTGTNAAEIAHALSHARHQAGLPAMDVALTLLVIADEESVSSAMRTASENSREHPSRIIGVIVGSGRGKPNLDARVRVGENTAGESLLLRISGPLVNHAESVVLPLLLPDSPVVAWWPVKSPENPAADPIGRLAQRRITDAEQMNNPARWLRKIARNYTPGDTDFTWTRLTLWRTMLAAALDQVDAPVVSGQMVADVRNPVANLLQAWLESRLGVEIEWIDHSDAQIQRVSLTTTGGEATIDRIDPMTCHFTVPGTSPRIVPIRRRTGAELLAEDLRRLDADEIYAETLEYLVNNV